MLAQRLNDLPHVDAQALRQRVTIIDFARQDPPSPYNIFARWPGADPDFFAGSRADLLMDLLPGTDKLSLGGASVLRRCIRLLSCRRRILTGCCTTM